uniref:Coiled-coil protein 142 C-terminal domain-containing protein n=1 Tax=Sparus aurata TaxID=8175 RepID=A0A671VRD6_SPAAU
MPSTSLLQGSYRTLRRLLEQRSLLLFIHEYTRRAHRTAKNHVDFRTETWLRCKHKHGNSNTKDSRGAYSQTQAFPPPLQVGLGSLSQELRVHLNHWSCLFSKVHSDYHLRAALVQKSRLLVEIKQTLDLLGLQALVLVEHFVFVILSAVAQTELESVPREVLEDILAGTHLYNQAVWERAQHSTTQLRTIVLQQPHYSTLDSSLPNSKGHQPAAFSVKELTVILALHHADMIAKQLHCWASDQSCHICQVHPNYEVCTCSDSSVSQWTWKQLQHTYISSSLFSIHHHPPSQSSHYTCHKTPPVYVPDLQRDSAILLNHHPIFAKPTFVQRGAEASNNDQSSQCQTYMFQTGSAQTSGEALLSVHPLSPLSIFLSYYFVKPSFSLFSRLSSVVCRSIGSALKDKCLTGVNQARNSVLPSSEQDGCLMMSVTMEHLLLLSPPLMSSLLTLQRLTVGLALATVQLSTVWVISKAYQFLSSWSLNKFLLITQGDLKVLTESVEMMVHQTKSLKMNLMLQLCVFIDQTFSSLMLKNFSSDCKRMSEEIFERTMPSAVHWRPSLRTGFPSNPSEYASLAAQTVIGQVLEGVAPLSDDARVQALSITMTAFMEAWMEHILKQKIKFSVQGALQLKQDFDSIRELIQSDKYGLSAELHQRLLSLRVFQQVDSAVVCLLQQPQAKPYLQSKTWEPFTRCPSNISRDSIDAVVGSSITNLRYMEGEDLTHSTVTYLFCPPSLALGNAQQEWLDLRIHSNTRRWRLPGLQCLSKSEP